MIQKATRTARTLLPATGSITQEQIDNVVDIVLNIPGYESVDRAQLVREIQSVYNIRIDDFKIIEAADKRVPWISERKAAIWQPDKTTFWGRYREYLETDKNFAPDVLAKLDRLTDKILDGLFDPIQPGAIDKRGLVVGQVQSGKTSNYTGLICKAADAGFKLIIVLAGIHNNLRSQTQLRLDEGFLGFDTQYQRAFNENNRWLGVGRIDQNIIAHSLTSSIDKGDFTARAANALGINFNTNEPIVAVVKKNASVLNRLLQWLLAQSVETPGGGRVVGNKSLLLIDDEADNASINTKPENDGFTRINELIRSILRLFNKSGYVGYTATPFANIFIPVAEQDDLFPRDFIVNLPAPTNYIGPETVFGFRPIEEDETSASVLPIVARVDDYQSLLPDVSHEEPQLPSELPESLKQAIRCFILTCTIRRLRGQTGAHNSMLVHVSRFIEWQRQIKDLVENVFNFYRRGIEMNIPTVIEEFKKTYTEDNSGYKSYPTISQQILDSNLASIDSYIQVHEWEDVLPLLNDAASRISVREINGGSADALNYFDHKNGLSVIAVGGDKLSRGLTLEGLSVSYYLRASRMYDTLMQMGRWFGYRPGYVDLCRLFISRELNEWFCHVTLASQQLRDEFDYMADVAGSTPDQYAVRVRTHPGVLQISASNKIRRAVEVRVSWSGRLVESYELCKDKNVVQKNYYTASSFIKGLGEPDEKIGNSYLFRNVHLKDVKQLLHGFQTYDNLKSAAPSNLLRFLELNEKHNELNTWSVGIISKERTTKRQIIGSLDVGFIKRTEDDDKSNKDLYYIRKSHIISPGDEFIDLTKEEFQLALQVTHSKRKSDVKTNSPTYPSGEVVRNTVRKPDRPLLLLYFLDPEGANVESNFPIVGYAISFPANDRDDAVSFAVNEQLLSLFNQQDDPEPIIQPDDED